MPRLLTLLCAPEAGGAEDYALVIAEAAAALGWDVTVGLTGDAAMNGVRERVRAAGAAPASIELIGGLRGGRKAAARRVAGHARDTRTLLARVRPAVVHLVLPWPDRGLGASIACRARRVPVLAVHQLVAEARSLGEPWWSLYRACLSGPQELVAVSEHNRRLLAEMFPVPTERIRLIHNGTDPVPELEPAAKAAARTSVLDEFGLSEPANLLLGVGRLEDQKGFDLLLPAFAALREDRPEAVLALAGDGERRADLERAACELGVQDAVLLLGRRGDVPRLLAAADAFAFPSRSEGQPFALLEAMAAGVAVVASDAPVVSDLTEAGRSALLFRSGDVEELTQALREVLDDRPAAAARAREAKVRAGQFTRERMVRETLAALAARSGVQGLRARTA